MKWIIGVPVVTVGLATIGSLLAYRYIVDFIENIEHYDWDDEE